MCCALELFVADSAYVPLNYDSYRVGVTRVSSEGDVSAMDRPAVVRDTLHTVGGVKPLPKDELFRKISYRIIIIKGCWMMSDIMGNLL